jgi:vacuolar-type H+-ATPase subunit H
MVESHEASHRPAKADVVEKLERILKVEDDARAALGDARDAARRALEDARQQSVEIGLSVAREADARAGALRTEMLDRATAEAADTGARVAEAARTALGAAGARLPRAGDRALGELVG